MLATPSSFARKVTRNFGGVTTATCVCHSRCESLSPRRRNEPLGYYFTIFKTLDRMLGLVGSYYRGEADLSFCLLIHLYDFTFLHIEI